MKEAKKVTTALDEEVLKVMTFYVGDTEYGLNITDVRDIVRIQDITYFPNQPSYIKGLINLRGKIVPTMDIGLKFNLPERMYDDRTCIVVIEKEETMLGVIVDRINEVKTFMHDHISQSPKSTEGKVNEFLMGIGQIDSTHTLLLKTEKVMSHEG
jgi:purine-binding chemotaxis protein CheW